MQYILTYKWGYRPRETDDKTASDTNCCYDVTENIQMTEHIHTDF